MLQTARLRLRNLCPADAAILFDYRNDSRCSRYQRYEDTDMSGLRRFVRNWSRSSFLSTEEEQHYAVERIADRVLLGDVSVFFSRSDNCFTLGITIAPRFQRQGYAFEILKEMPARIRSRYPSADLVALIEKENAASIALFRKLGFTEECWAESIRSYVYTISGSDAGRPQPKETDIDGIGTL